MRDSSPARVSFTIHMAQDARARERYNWRRRSTGRLAELTEAKKANPITTTSKGTMTSIGLISLLEFPDICASLICTTRLSWLLSTMLKAAAPTTGQQSKHTRARRPLFLLWIEVLSWSNLMDLPFFAVEPKPLLKVWRCRCLLNHCTSSLGWGSSGHVLLVLTFSLWPPCFRQPTITLVLFIFQH